MPGDELPVRARFRPHGREVEIVRRFVLVDALGDDERLARQNGDVAVDARFDVALGDRAVLEVAGLQQSDQAGLGVRPSSRAPERQIRQPIAPGRCPILPARQPV
jgi:hypothetical protein